MISYDYWTRRFSRDPAVVGTTLFVKNVPLTIVGITAGDFRGVEPAIATDFWIPLQNRPELNVWGNLGKRDEPLRYPQVVVSALDNSS